MRYNGLFEDAASPLVLAATGDVVVSFFANNAVVLKMSIAVRNAADHDVLSVGVKEGSPRLSSGNGNNRFSFSPEKLAGASYVKWMIWAEYPGPGAVTFDVTVRVTQNGVSNDAVKQYQLADGTWQALLEEDGDYLDIAAVPAAGALLKPAAAIAAVKPKATAPVARVKSKGGAK
ncbi:hypothetical protein [Duganella vulcania]|uniref:Uncharacterized protein n=1 Tax=Duganella vulcania TaxID=2692166 RepID=A0A845GFZ5_9BURK|nr:hypothetical protein [Duganella vulcania]MYM92430.1 hypothetical protein [Duganella vulcania]